MSSNTVLNVVLIVLLVVISYFHIARGLEYFRCTSFAAGDIRRDMRSQPAPLLHSAPSVFSSLPPQSQSNAAWRYLAPYQSACLAGKGKGKGKGKGQCITCGITPHNQRYCQWS